MQGYQKLEIGTAIAASASVAVIFFLFMRLAFQHEPVNTLELLHFGSYMFIGWLVSLLVIAGVYYDVTKPLDKTGRIMVLAGWAYTVLAWGSAAFFILIWGSPAGALMTVTPAILSSITVLMAYSDD
jgi:hypothetical protein